MEWIKIVLKSFAIIILQIILFDNLQIHGWGYPMVYILPLLTLPMLPKWAEMPIGMIVGLIIDICNNSLGVHMAACIAICFIKPYILKRFIQDLERIKGEISSISIGRIEFSKYIIALICLHHLVVFGLEAWSFHNWWLVILQTIVSSVLTILIVLGYDFIRK
jgi:rod shape-determining protein MreD